MTLPPGWLVHRYESVTCTMDVAARLAVAGARDRTAVVSAEQTAGRGRGGRVWRAPAGSGLFCTLIVRPPVDPPRLPPLPLLAGVAVAEAIEELGDTASPQPPRLPTYALTPLPPSPVEPGEGGNAPLSLRDGPGAPQAAVGARAYNDAEVSSRNPYNVRLKWPNDVWLGDDAEPAKVAGILVTSRLAGGRVDYALVGIGVNVRARPDELPPGATSLLAAGIETTVESLCDAVLGRFDEVYGNYLASAGHASLDPWRTRAALLGEEVTVAEGAREWRGTFVGVDDDGALLLRHADLSLSRIVAGDLVRGPRTAFSRSDNLPEADTYRD